MMRSLREGFINSAINPKTTVFFLGLFTQVIDPTTHVVVQALYGMEIATIVGLWFVALSFALSVDTIKRQFGKVHHVVAKMMGGLLVLLGVRVAFASNS
jgi:threonine/homoserine/homoserine lactone efflux protein